MERTIKTCDWCDSVIPLCLLSREKVRTIFLDGNVWHHVSGGGSDPAPKEHMCGECYMRSKVLLAQPSAEEAPGANV